MPIQPHRSGLATTTLSVALAALLTACGGSTSDEDEEVTISFAYTPPGASAPLWTPFDLAPDLLGLGNQSIGCVLSGGLLPPGLGLDNDNCHIVGTPTEAGVFSFSVRMNVDGVSLTFTASSELTVDPPSLIYDGQPIEELTFGAVTVSTPAWEVYVPTVGDSVTNFRVEAGVLPWGLQIDPDTGVISGTYLGLGAPEFTVAATITHNGQTIDVTSPPIDPDGETPTVSYPTGVVVGHVGQAFESPAPLFNGTFPITGDYAGNYLVDLTDTSHCSSPQALPDTLGVDTATGIARGTPEETFEGCVPVAYEVQDLNGNFIAGWTYLTISIRP